MAHHQPRHAAARNHVRRCTGRPGAHAARPARANRTSAAVGVVKVIGAGLTTAAVVTGVGVAVHLAGPTGTTVAGELPHTPAATGSPTPVPSTRPSPYLHTMRLDARPTVAVVPPHVSLVAAPGSQVEGAGVAPFSAQTRQELAEQKRKAGQARQAEAEAQARDRERESNGDTASRSQDRPAPAVGGSPQQIAQQLLAARGWSSQFGCLQAMWNRESGWNPQAQNPGSGAYGIPQALPGSKMAAFGADWRTNPQTQIEWGLWYIKARYGTPCGAWSYWQAHNYY